MKRKHTEKDLIPYSVQEAIAKVKAGKKRNFDASIELHIYLDIDTSKSNIRYTTTLPHGSGKEVKIAVLASKKVPEADLELSEADIEKIAKEKIRPKADFDILVAEPSFMPKIAKAARVLGPAGAMPNPKLGTVTDDVAKAVEELKKGKVEIRTEKDVALIHTVIGKMSFEETALVENIVAVLESLKANKPTKTKPNWVKSIAVCSTMGPAFRVQYTL
jgi:large subunit ribosomal protein L1